MKNLRYGIALGLLFTFYNVPAEAWGTAKDVIYNAAKNGDYYTIENYLSRGYSIDTPDGNGMSALCTAYLEGNKRAYNLLLRYGANSYAECMYAPTSTTTSSSSLGLAKGAPWPYYASGALLAAGGIAAAASGGGGGGSDSSSGDGSSDSSGGNSGGNNDNSDGNNDNSGGNNDNSGGNNDNSGDNGNNSGDSGDNGNSGSGDSGSNGDNGGNNAEIDDPIFEPLDRVQTFYTNDDFKNSPQFGNEFFFKTSEVTDSYVAPVNYLGAINVLPAYTKFTGVDAQGNFADNLYTVTVGVLDTGVWGNHPEFKLSDGSSKVSGYNFDYGPCRGSDRTNCYAVVKKGAGNIWEAIASWISGPEIKSVFFDANGNMHDITTISSEEDMNKLIQWASYYYYLDENGNRQDYDWDKLQNYVYPNSGIIYDEYGSKVNNAYNPSFLHGTNVAGIIASNRDGNGTMGVAFSNARIKAVRWDFISPMDAPIAKLVEDSDNVRVINLSLGQEGMTEQINAASLSSLNELAGDYKAAVRSIVNKNTLNSRNKIDGIIVVRAAGNEGLSNPDLESGIKRLNNVSYIDNNGTKRYYRDLQMLIVAAANVTVDADGNLISYKISDYSNRCGATGSYCITAPGGTFTQDINGDYTTMTQGMFGPGEPGALTSLYDYTYYATGGTSQATPIVSGAIAFLEGAYPYMSAEEVIELLRDTANKTKSEDFGTEYTDSDFEAVYGAGLLDLGKAVTSYVAPSGSQSISTFIGNNVTGERISLDDATLNIPSKLRYIINSALPETITVFDRYTRPFELSTANYIKATHGGYKSFKNDVENIAITPETQTQTEGNFRFSFNQGRLTSNGSGTGLMDITYTQGKNAYGFYFSENTTYKTAGTQSVALKNPFMSFTNAYGLHNTYNFSRNTNLRIEAISGRNGLYDGDYDYHDATFKKQAYALNAELNLHKSKKFAFGVSTGMLYEQDALLGLNGKGAFTPDGGNTYTTGVTVSWFASPKWTFSGSYYRGYTQGQKFASGMLRTSDMISSSFAFDANYRQDKTTDYGLRFSSPLMVEKGSLYVDFPSGRDNYSDTIYRQTYKADMKPQHREFRLMGYYNKALSENISLRTEGGVRFNPEHEAAANDYRALFGLSWNFN